MVDDQIDYVEISLNSEPAIMSSPKEEIKVSESLLDPADIKQDDEEVSKSDPAEISPEQEALEDSENLIPKEQTTAAKPVEKSNPKQKNKIHDEEVDEHLYEPIKTIISKDNELRNHFFLILNQKYSPQFVIINFSFFKWWNIIL